MHDSLRQQRSQALSATPERFESVSGGCISDAYACYLSDGRKVFYPLLAHVNLFPGSYVSSCGQALQRYV